MIKKDNIIKFKPEWQDHGDDDIEFRAVDDEYDGRVEVVACIDLPLRPTQIVPIKWLDVPEDQSLLVLHHRRKKTEKAKTKNCND